MNNPYDAPVDPSLTTIDNQSRKPSAPYLWAAFIGAACGGMLTVAFAFYQLYQDRLFLASLPAGQGFCATEMVNDFHTLVYYVAPCISFLVAGIGCLMAHRLSGRKQRSR